MSSLNALLNTMPEPQSANPQLALSREDFAVNYNRTPFGFNHNLHTLDLFGTESLQELCRLYADHPGDFYVSRSAATPGTVFYSVPAAKLAPHEAFDQLTAGSYKILLKRLERHDRRFRDLLDELFGQLRAQLRANGHCDDIVRLDSSIFISAPFSTTPFHFDPEVNFFAQIEGEKMYHLYPPSVLREDEVEPLYVRAAIDIGQVDLARRDPSAEHVFRLEPGCGLHQPQDAPHWVETAGSRSVSYTIVYETRESRSLGRVRAFNHYLRRLQVEPTRPGKIQSLDAFKAATMIAANPLKRQLGKAIRGALRR